MLRDITDKVGELAFTVTERLLKSGFTIKGLTENLWTNI